MITAEETRERLRAGVAAARRRESQRPPWTPLDVSRLQVHVPVLAFDASLANVGWVLAFVMEDRVHVSAHGTIRPEARDDGYMGTWRRAAELRTALLVNDVFRDHRRPGAVFAVEAPLVGGGHRKESSLIAGLMVWQTFDDVRVVSATHVSAVLLGDARVTSAERKKRVKAEVCRLVPEVAGRNFNEHERDALSVALVTLHDMREAP